MLQIEQAFKLKFLPKLKATIKAEVKRSQADASGTGSIAVSSAMAEDAAFGASPAGTPGTKGKGPKADEDENEEANEEYQEGKLRFAGVWVQSVSKSALGCWLGSWSVQAPI